MMPPTRESSILHLSYWLPTPIFSSFIDPLLLTTKNSTTQMQIDPNQSSQWMTDFHKQIVRGKSVVLHGNLSDYFILNGEVCKVREFLDRYFDELKLTIIADYDIADGLKFFRPEMHDTFRKHLTQAVQSSPSIPGRTMPSAGGNAATDFRLPELAFAALKQVLAQSTDPTSVCIYFADRLASDPKRFDASERQLMVQLGKLLESKAEISSGSCVGFWNTLVILSTELSALPEWLYRNNPHLALVHVRKPDREERRILLNFLLPQFHEGVQKQPKNIEDDVSRLVELTEGMTACDLNAMRRTSVAEKIGLDQPKVLVDFFKYGQREDPYEKLDSAKLKSAREALQQRVIGQEKAVDAVVEMLISARVGIEMTDAQSHRAKPRGIFFFVGPTGVGKTELAKALTEMIFGDEQAFARFDMSEYKEQHTAQRLTGSPPGYVGFDEGGQLTNRMIERPFSVLLFDEIEKAHPQVLDYFLQILEDGRLTDSKGQTAYFSQSVIIFTSNIGSDSMADLLDGNSVISNESPTYEKLEAHFKECVRLHFVQEIKRPELFNRIGENVLAFDMLRPRCVDGITSKFLKLMAGFSEQKRGIKLDFSDGMVEKCMRDTMTQKQNALNGGRGIRNQLEAQVLRPLSRWIFENEIGSGASLRVSMSALGTLDVATESQQ
jgi:energy-coupling factor transporter ATP-binding protein EcfA2